MQAIIKAGYAAWYESVTGLSPQQFGDDCLLDVVSISEQGAVVDNGIVNAFIPHEYLDMKGVQNETVSQTRQADQS